jgi:hypothetical protein
MEIYLSVQRGVKMSEDQSINDAVLPDTEETIVSPKQDQAALTIVVKSWATPILSALMLVLGLLGGYYGRPLIEPQPTLTDTQEDLTTGEAAVPTPDADLVAQQQALMTAVISETRHFRGNLDAPVTIIEFSDFQ